MAVLFFIVFIDLVGFGIVIPLLPFYAEHFGASPDRVTLVMASYSLAQFFFAPIWGRLSDRFGRRPILLVSLAFSVASYLWLGFADALWMLYAARLLAGAGAGNIGAAQAYVADITPPAGRAKGMGLIGAAFGLGFTVGPALGGLIAGSDPTAASVARPAFVAAGLSAVAFIGTLVFLRESLAAAHGMARRPSRWRLAQDAFGRPALRQLILVLFVTLTAFAGMETTFALWAEGAFGWGPRQVGGIFFFVGIVLILVQGGLIGRLTKRFGEARLLLAGSLAITLGLVGLPFSHGLAAVLLATALLALGMGLASPSINSLISRRARADQQGGTLGVAQSAGSLARIIGPAIAGAVFAAWGRNAPYWLGAALMLAVVALALGVLRDETERAAAATAPEQRS
jgi:DHA1 family tetracycline resistance protein-like MFS transporter